MLKIVINLLILAVSIAVVGSLIQLNPSDVTVVFWESKISTSIGIAIVTSFFLGLILCAALGVYFQLKSWIRERKLLLKNRRLASHDQLLVNARAAKVSGELTRAKAIFAEVLSKDPSDLLARIELADTLVQLGFCVEALSVVEDGRNYGAALDKAELLFKSAEINLLLNNRTSSIDNLTLLLSSHPNAKAARMARDISIEIARYSDAVSYHNQACTLDSSLDNTTLAKLLGLQVLHDGSLDTNRKIKELTALISRYPESKELILMMIDIYKVSSSYELAAKFTVDLLQLDKNNGSAVFISRLKTLIEFCSRITPPERSIAIVKTAIRDFSGSHRVLGLLSLGALQAFHGGRELCQKYLQEALNVIDKLEGDLDASSKSYAAQSCSYISEQISSYPYHFAWNVMVATTETISIREIVLMVLAENVDRSQGDIKLAPDPKLATP